MNKIAAVATNQWCNYMQQHWKLSKFFLHPKPIWLMKYYSNFMHPMHSFCSSQMILPIETNHTMRGKFPDFTESFNSVSFFKHNQTSSQSLSQWETLQSVAYCSMRITAINQFLCVQYYACEMRVQCCTTHFHPHPLPYLHLDQLQYVYTSLRNHSQDCRGSLTSARLMQLYVCSHFCTIIYKISRIFQRSASKNTEASTSSPLSSAAHQTMVFFVPFFDAHHCNQCAHQPFGLAPWSSAMCVITSLCIDQQDFADHIRAP